MPSEGPIVVGVDGSPASRAALRVAAEEARLRRKTLRVVMVQGVVEHIPAGDLPTFAPGMTQEAARADLDEIVETELGPRPDLPVERVVVCDLAAKGLLSESRGASMLVVGARGVGGLLGLLLGSVSQQVVHHATCPVLVVPHRAEEHTRPRATVPQGEEERRADRAHV